MPIRFKLLINLMVYLWIASWLAGHELRVMHPNLFGP